MGSSEEIGNAQYIPQDEKHILSPKSPYGVSKCAARYITKVYRESYDLYAIQGITFNFTSKRRGLEFITAKVSHAVGKIKNSINNNLPIESLVVGNLESKRSWQHCLDVCDGIWRMLNQDAYNKEFRKELDSFENKLKENILLGGALNEDFYTNLFKKQTRSFFSPKIKEYVLSSDTCHSVRDFVELAFKRAGIDIIDVNPDRIEPAKDTKGQQINYVLDDYNKTPLVLSSREFFRPADVTYLHGDSSLIKKELGWKPKYDFEMLVNEMVDSALTEHVK
jgi:GDPmannose 4,6-dehydratase